MVTFTEDNVFLGEMFLKNPSKDDLNKDHLINFFKEQQKTIQKEVTTETPSWHEPRHDEDKPTEQEVLGELKDVIKDDWCASMGGVWRTIRGNKICILPGEGAAEAFRRQRFARIEIPGQEKGWTIKDNKKLTKLRTQNNRRKELWKEYNKEYDNLPNWVQDSVQRRVIYGSYVTDKEKPGDIDVVLFIDSKVELTDDQTEYLFGELEEKFNKPTAEVNFHILPDDEEFREEYLECMKLGEEIRGYEDYQGIQH